MCVSVHMLQLPAALEAFDAHGLRAQNDRLIDIPDMITVLTSLYEVTGCFFITFQYHSLDITKKNAVLYKASVLDSKI
jgi:hypothetical protein